MKTLFILFLGFCLSGIVSCAHIQTKKHSCGEVSCNRSLFQLALLEQQTSPNAIRLRKQLQDSCKKRSADSCVYYGIALFFGLGGSYRVEKGQKLLYSECAKRIQLACTWSYRIALLVNRELDKLDLLAILQDNCDEGHLESCGLCGGAYLEGFGLAKNYHKAAAELRSVCEGEQTGCLGYALCLDLGLGVQQDAAEARRLAKTACNRSNADACSMLGSHWDMGRGGPQSKTRANEYYEKGCQGYSLLGCNRLAAAMQEQKSPLKRSKARAYVGFTCRLGDIQSCSDYADLLLDDNNLESDRKARGFYTSACQKGVMIACENLAGLYEKGIGGDPNIDEAIIHSRLACESGIETACKRMKRLTDKKDSAQTNL